MEHLAPAPVLVTDRAATWRTPQMTLKAGTRLRSTVGSTEIIVVKAPAADVEITCGGAAMGDPASTEATAGDPPAPGTGTAMGKRYVNADGSLEVLCTKPGSGTLAADGEALTLKEAKPLPASD
jgi:hypothetical protein